MSDMPPIDAPREDPRVTSMLDLGAPPEHFFPANQAVMIGLMLMLNTFYGMVRRFRSWNSERAIFKLRMTAMESRLDALDVDEPV
jgi:hypothetical protein